MPHRLTRRGATGLLMAMLAVWLVSGHARADVAYVHEIKGKVKYRSHGGRQWGPLPPNLLVRAGDQLRLKAGDRARVVYLGKGNRSRLLRGPIRLTIRGPRGRRSARSSRSTPFSQLLKLLVTRSVSYHRLGQSTLSTSAQNRLDLTQHRYSVVKPGHARELRWLPRRGHRRYRIAVWRYTADFKEQRVSGVVSCVASPCRWRSPATFPLVPGRRYFWNVRILGAGTKPYPVDGVWFSVATPSVLKDLEHDHAAALKAPAGAARALQRALAYAKHGFHQRALQLLKGHATGQAKALKARLLCVTCRTAQANRLAGKPTFCRCKEEPDR